MSKKNYSRIVTLLFILNAAFLTWAILWKCGVPTIGGTERMINSVPFQGNTSWEMQFNVLLFVPFGFMLAAVWNKEFPWKLLAVAAASVAFEIIQFVLAIGRSDITDVLLNTLGGLIGLGFYYLLAQIFRKRAQAAVMGVCLLITAFEIYVSVSFILYGMVRLGTVMFRM